MGRHPDPWWLILGAVLTVVWLESRPGWAQISPGRLSQAHASLEGSAHCLDCHQSRKGVDPARCLDCHEILGQRIEAGAGLHARPEYRACETCHIEHHGRAFELIWWGEEGMTAFDHASTGYVLEGAHEALACRDCHRAANLRQAEALKAAGKSLERTFLGLGTDCLSCHADEHRDQLGATCRSCHGVDSWVPAPLFDHRRTSFPLSGAHREVACASCHPEVAVEGGRGEVFTRYRGVAAGSCGACHQDPHRGRLGEDCQACHGTESWQRVDPSHFDHERTRYPLRGRHRQVPCASCHPEGGARAIAGFERCETCHVDPHRGQFRDGPGGGDCSSCHGLDGFEPALYLLEDHQESSFPLTGAHLAVPCVACHRPVPAADLPLPIRPARMGTEPGSGRVLQFDFPSFACTECHRDPHLGDADAYLGGEGCASCHGVDTWEEVIFDHGRTGFALLGAHAGVSCTECHRPQGSGSSRVIRLRESSRACRGCHEDPHRGQLDREGRAAGCGDCHNLLDWRPTGFDHDRDAAFPLQGAHRKVACRSCHSVEEGEGGSFVRLRPLAHACSDCHSAGGPS